MCTSGGRDQRTLRSSSPRPLRSAPSLRGITDKTAVASSEGDSYVRVAVSIDGEHEAQTFIQFWFCSILSSFSQHYCAHNCKARGHHTQKHGSMLKLCTGDPMVSVKAGEWIDSFFNSILEAQDIVSSIEEQKITQVSRE